MFASLIGKNPSLVLSRMFLRQNDVDAEADVGGRSLQGTLDNDIADGERAPFENLVSSRLGGT